ncbi:MAG: glutamate--tRNA ligase [Phycisphaeraceae bacterium]|nr:glutamate--tRNA ligase [Phycisphaeraceae bacterium]
MTTLPITTRFAPSPTGALHVGGARTALFAWAYAKQHGGKFIIRIEDTDQKRSSPQSTKGILQDLQWLGLNWDQGPNPDATDPYADQIGEQGPYFQSQRLDIYNKHINTLVEQGLAYEDDGAIRFRMDKDIAFTDAVYGDIKFAAADLEDFVIRKADGFPTFHLAVVVDDALMNVTHVIRGQEHLINTSKHVALLDALGFAHPTYAHTPSIMNPDGSKMSKRDKAKVARKAAKEAKLTSMGGDDDAFTEFLDKKNDDMKFTLAIARLLELELPEINVSDFRDSGYLPAALLNYIALLGWNPGDDIEQFDMAFLVEKFGLGRIGKSNSKFDRTKLRSFNTDAIGNLDSETFSKLLRKQLSDHHPQYNNLIEDSTRFAAFCAAYQPRAHTLDEVATLGHFFVADNDAIVYNENDKATKKNLLKNEGKGLKTLAEFAVELAKLEPWSGEAGHDLIKNYCDAREMNMGQVAQPLRIALSGTTVTPDMALTLDIMGKSDTLKRIERCLSTFQSQ